jgi:hypothetical protein
MQIILGVSCVPSLLHLKPRDMPPDLPMTYAYSTLSKQMLHRVCRQLCGKAHPEDARDAGVRHDVCVAHHRLVSRKGPVLLGGAAQQNDNNQLRNTEGRSAEETTAGEHRRRQASA